MPNWSSTRVLIVGDLLGLTVLAVQVTVVYWLAPNDGYRVLSGILIYLVLATAALGLWHYEKLAKRFSSPNRWLALVGGSILLGGVSFGADILIGTHFGSGNSSALDAASRVGGPLGFSLTLMICPGLTAVAVAGLARSLLRQVAGPST